MSKRTRFGLRRKRETKAYGLATASPALLETMSLLDGSLASYGTLYRQLQPVRTVVDFIADAVATTPLKVYERQESGRPEVRDHPFAELLRSPNPELTPMRLMFGTVADLAVYGNAYWRKVETGRSRYLVPLPPYRVTPKGGDLLSAAAYEFWTGGGTTPITLAREEVVHFRFYDPEDRRIGASKLQALKNILTEEIEASRYRRSFWRNHAQIEGVLEHPEQLSDDAIGRLRTQFDNIHSGDANAGRTAILEDGMTWKPTGFSSKDAEFMLGRRFVLEATAHVYNMPLALLSLTDTATYASQREFRKQLYTEVLPPWYELIASEIELQVMPWFTGVDDLYPEFVVEAKLRGDFIDQAKIVLEAVGRPYMTVHEGRDLFNMDDRGVASDDELAVPVGPNFALESQAEEASEDDEEEEATPLQAVASLPAGRMRRAVAEFFDHQERSVMARMGAGKAFEQERWNRALTPVLGDAGLAERVNLAIAIALAHTDDPHAVFSDARARVIAAVDEMEVAQ